MGMKANAGYFKNTSSNLKYSLDLQLFASKKMSITGRLYYNAATSPKLKNTIKELYRPGSKVGDGGTAAAIKKQIKTGKLVGGRDHTIKGKERIKNLDNLLKSGKLNKKDQLIAKKLKGALQKALGKK